MRRLIKYINDNVLIKEASLNTTSLLVKIISGVLTTKAIAIFIGPEGMALIGNLKDFLNSVQSFATLGFYKGIVKSVSKFKNNIVELSKTISTVFYIGLVSTLIMSLLCYYNADYISSLIFFEYNYTNVIKTMAIALPFYSLNLFSFSIINGFSKYKTLLIINIIGQVLGLFVTLILIWQNNIDGALVAVVITPSLMLLITAVAIINRRNLTKLIRISKVDFKLFKSLSSYSIMALITVIALSIVTIVIRNYIIDNLSMREAGYWEGMNRISTYYLIFVNALLSFYILPRFSEINTIKEFRTEVFDFYKIIMPIFGMGLLVIYLLRPFIVAVVFSTEFKPMEELFGWYLLGDFVKVLSAVIAYQFLAKHMFWHYIITEIFLVITIYLTSIYFIDLEGVKGATIAHFVSYVGYFIVILLIFGTSLFGVIQDGN